MIYVTGDLHGDLKRFSAPALRALKKGDTLLVCGDFGFLWQGGAQEEKALDAIAKRHYQIAFVEGTHDNLELLRACPREEWNGGQVHRIRPNLVHLIRGEIFTLEGMTFLAMGGGSSDDNAPREEGVNWWPEELPREEELPLFRQKLEEHRWRLDFILSHQAPTNIDACVNRKVCDVTLLTAFLDELQRKGTFEKWYFGRYHQNKMIPPAYQALYDQVLLAGGEKKKWRFLRQKG